MFSRDKLFAQFKEREAKRKAEEEELLNGLRKLQPGNGKGVGSLQELSLKIVRRNFHLYLVWISEFDNIFPDMNNLQCQVW
jgi:hypothetical protein